MTAKNKKTDHGILAKGSVQKDGFELALFSGLYTFDGEDTYTADHTFALADLNRLQTMNSGAAHQFLIPTDASVAFPNKIFIPIRTIGTGLVTVTCVTPGTTTLVSTGIVVAAPLLRAQYSGAGIYKIGTNSWWASGDLT